MNRKKKTKKQKKEKRAKQNKAKKYVLTGFLPKIQNFTLSFLQGRPKERFRRLTISTSSRRKMVESKKNHQLRNIA